MVIQFESSEFMTVNGRCCFQSTYCLDKHGDTVLSYSRLWLVELQSDLIQGLASDLLNGKEFGLASQTKPYFLYLLFGYEKAILVLN